MAIRVLPHQNGTRNNFIPEQIRSKWRQMSHREEEEEDQVKGWFYTLKMSYIYGVT